MPAIWKINKVPFVSAMEPKPVAFSGAASRHGAIFAAVGRRIAGVVDSARTSVTSMRPTAFAIRVISAMCWQWPFRRMLAWPHQ